MNERKIFVVGNSINYANWMQGTLVDQIVDADLVVFTGGEDVNPYMYEAKKHPSTHYNYDRDVIEEKYFKIARGLDKKMIGICRGSQLLCVLSGGRLVQHMSHPSHHKIELYDGSTIEVTSSHHQMMYPFVLHEKKYKMVGWTVNLSRMHQDGSGSELNMPEGKEPEIVYFNETKALCIQSHPEWQDPNSYSVKKFQELLDHHMNNTLMEELKGVAV